ncbi:hypothetical protein BDB01DRAFT_31104 [Pilobolus umbonatus]|nr:hypothetical protein BDB01DRAFT_31104 [Pilobolus umbonatus]
MSFLPSSSDHKKIEDGGKINLVSNSISSINNELVTTKESLKSINFQKKSAEQYLQLLQQQKKSTQQLLEPLKLKVNVFTQNLEELKSQLKTQQEEWGNWKAEYTTTNDILLSKKQEIEKLTQEQSENEKEKEKLKRIMHNKQMEYIRLTRELEQLQSTYKREQEYAALKEAETLRKKQEEQQLQKEQQLQEEKKLLDEKMRRDKEVAQEYGISKSQDLTTDNPIDEGHDADKDIRDNNGLANKGNIPKEIDMTDHITDDMNNQSEKEQLTDDKVSPTPLGISQEKTSNSQSVNNNQSVEAQTTNKSMESIGEKEDFYDAIDDPLMLKYSAKTDIAAHANLTDPVYSQESNEETGILSVDGENKDSAAGKYTNASYSPIDNKIVDQTQGQYQNPFLYDGDEDRINEVHERIPYQS